MWIHWKIKKKNTHCGQICVIILWLNTLQRFFHNWEPKKTPVQMQNPPVHDIAVHSCKLMNSQLEESMQKLWDFFSRFKDCSVSWIPRSWNFLPHHIAKWTFSREVFGFISQSSFPSDSAGSMRSPNIVLLVCGQLETWSKVFFLLLAEPSDPPALITNWLNHTTRFCYILMASL